MSMDNPQGHYDLVKILQTSFFTDFLAFLANFVDSVNFQFIFFSIKEMT